jgi:hypothetical protein
MNFFRFAATAAALFSIVVDAVSVGDKVRALFFQLFCARWIILVQLLMADFDV